MVSSAAALRAGAPGADGGAALAERIDPAGLSSIFSLLSQQNDALRALEVSVHALNSCEFMFLLHLLMVTDHECVTILAWLLALPAKLWESG